MAPPLKDEGDQRDSSSSPRTSSSSQQPAPSIPPQQQPSRASRTASVASVEIDVDDLEDSMRFQSQQLQTENDSSIDTRDLLAIARELEEVDRETKEDHKKKAASPPRAVRAKGRTPPRTPQRPIRSTSRPGAHPFSPVARSTPATVGHQQQQRQASSSIEKERPGSANQALKKERDAAAEDDEINPVLLRHLAEEQQPGAFPSNARPPNLAVLAQSAPPALPSSSAAISASITAPTSQLPPSSQPTPDSTAQSSSNRAQTSRAQTPPANPEDQELIEASLVPQNGGTSPPTFQNNSSNDIENTPHTYRHQESAHSQTNDNNIPTGPPPGVVEAEDAGIKDFLQNRTFCLFFMGYLCAIVTIAALVIVIIVLQRESEAITSSYPQAGEILTEYIDPTKNPSQFDAFQWINTHPDIDQYPHWRKVQLYALTTFYFALNFRDWPQVDRTYILSMDIPECQWNEKYGILPCGQGEHDYGVLRQLQLLGNESEEYFIPDVRGTLPAEVAFLRSLDTIHIGYTDLNAKLEQMLPRQLETLANLTTLNYGANQLQSTIPTRISNLKSLALLSLRSNQLTAQIPSQLGRLTTLTSLQLQYNQLEGRLPIQLGHLGANLKDLSLRDNRFTGALPSHLARLQQLTSLTLQRNSFEDTIPTEIGLLTNLETLQLWGNRFTGALPSQLGLLSASLLHLDLHMNRFSGTLPTELGLLTQLRRLLVHQNDGLTGPVPQGLCGLHSLTKFRVDCVHVDCIPDSCTCSCYRF